jgi:hypothetical protein
MRSRSIARGVLPVLFGGVLSAGSLPRIELPKNSPVAVLSVEGESNEIRGGAMIVDLHATLSMRNSSQRRIRGITLLVTAQEVTPGGKGSVSLPSLDVAPGDTFPVRIDVRLLRPLQAGSGAPVQVGLDGVLFDDLSFFGPDTLKSRRTLTVYELEARRDRKYYKALLAENPLKLQQEILACLARMTDRPGFDAQMVRGGRATNFEPEKQLQFAFLQLADSPVEPIEGMARVAGNEARAPRLEVKNRSTRAIQYLEIGWILRDQQGRQFVAGSLPAELQLAPGQKSQVLKDTTLKFPPPRTGQPLSIQGMTGFVSNVEFADGTVWIPSRADLSDPQLQQVLPPSAEEQRLVQLYQKRGGQRALAEELKKY